MCGPACVCTAPVCTAPQGLVLLPSWAPCCRTCASAWATTRRPASASRSAAQHGTACTVYSNVQNDAARAVSSRSAALLWCVEIRLPNNPWQYPVAIRYQHTKDGHTRHWLVIFAEWDFKQQDATPHHRAALACCSLGQAPVPCAPYNARQHTHHSARPCMRTAACRVTGMLCVTLLACDCVVCCPCPLSAAPPLPAAQAWLSLPRSVRNGGNPSREEALQAVAVINRVRRLLSEHSGVCVSRHQVCVYLDTGVASRECKIGIHTT